MRILDALEYLDYDLNVRSHELREDILEFLETIEYMLLNTEFHDIAMFARNWRSNHLDEHHLFDRFIQEKAWEIGSGDHVSDYYQALLMRRDQLLALRDVLKEYLNVLSMVYSQDREKAPSQMNLFDIHSGIVLRAQDYQRARDEVLQAKRQQQQSLDDQIERIEVKIFNDDEKKPKVARTKKSAQA